MKQVISTILSLIVLFFLFQWGIQLLPQMFNTLSSMLKTYPVYDPIVPEVPAPASIPVPDPPLVPLPDPIPEDPYVPAPPIPTPEPTQPDYPTPVTPDPPVESAPEPSPNPTDYWICPIVGEGGC